MYDQKMIIREGCFIPLPMWIRNKNACVNVSNSGDRYCFKWAIIAAIFQATMNLNRRCTYGIDDIKDDIIIVKERVQLNNTVASRRRAVDFSGLCFPMTVSQIKLFESKNPLISINVYGVDNANDKIAGFAYKSQNPKRISDHIAINLLLIQHNQHNHFVWISRLERLLGPFLSYDEPIQPSEDETNIETVEKMQCEEATNEQIVDTTSLKEEVFSAPIVYPTASFSFKRKLIREVQKHPEIFDYTLQMFSNEEYKYIIWNTISSKLNANIAECQHTWVDLRYEYQRYVRRLRLYQRFDNKIRKRRPVFAFENEMLFLWRFIRNTSLAPMPLSKLSNQKKKPAAEDEDDDIVILDEEPEIIVLDDEDKITTESNVPKFKISPEMRKILELVESYPELYDSNNRYFKDYRRKGIIWNAIANEAHDKATRLMKLWIQLQTRFEWELWHNKTPMQENDENDLRFLMKFMKDDILKNPNTVYKQSLFLKLNWHEPIDHFKNVFNLIALLKKNLLVINETEKKISPNKDTAYVSSWTSLAKLRGDQYHAGQLETTWLILRFFYWELLSMRKTSYQLQDKWYFESIITEMYAKARELNPDVFVTEALTTNADTFVPRTLTPKLTGSLAPSPPFASNIPLAQPQMPPLLPVTPAQTPVPTVIRQTPSQPQNQQQMMLPKILSAKSLAVPSQANQTQKSNGTTKGLQIVQVLPQNSTSVQPTPQPMNVYTSTSAAASAATTQQRTATQQPNSRLPLAASGHPGSQQQIRLHIPPQNPQNLQQLPKIASVHTMASNANAVRPSSTTTNSLSQNPYPTRLIGAGVTTPATTTATLTSTNPLNTVHNIPATIVPIRAPMHLNKSNSANNTPMKFVGPAPRMTAVRAKKPAQAQPVAILSASQSPLVPIALSSAQPLPQQQQHSLVPAALNNNNNLQINVINKENNVTNNNNAANHLNHNEIMIELTSTVDGNRLIVYGPSLPAPYSINMTEVSAFIREAMAIPLLHNKCHSQTARVQAYWEYLSKKFKMSVHICRSIWNFLAENIHHFPKIAPIEILLSGPFRSEVQAWQEGSGLFKRFYGNVVKKGWLAHEEKLPIVMIKISEERCLYQDLMRSKGVAVPNSNLVRNTWQRLRTFFGISDIDEIWNAFKSVFWQYMQEMEYGYENHWPQRLWRTLAKMEFLVYHRYSIPQDPFYFIVRSKFREEISRCKCIENSSAKETAKPSAPDVNLPETNVACTSTSTLEATTPYEIDAYYLFAAMRRHTATYQPCDKAAKEEAWAKVAAELNTSVMACRLSFQRALKNYRTYVVRDAANRCNLNRRYYKNMHIIYRAVLSAQKINIKTPSELNQSVSGGGAGGVSDTSGDSIDTVFPERMILDINMDSSQTALVMKNWVYGIGNCPLAVQKSLPEKLQSIFSSYEKYTTN